MQFSLSRSTARRAVVLAAVISLGSLGFAADIKPTKKNKKGAGADLGLHAEDRQPTPQVAPASPEGESGLKRIHVPTGFKLDLWAAEPMLANPVAFSIDEKGRIFVSETYRYRTSVLDIRHYMFMLEDDLACRTVDDRIAISKKWFGDKFNDLSIETEVVRLLEDRTGSGVANFSAVYADKFNSALDGIASGTLARKGKVYFTNIPELWELGGTDKSGHAITRKSLSHGYGVRYSYTGHDMHGLTFGPDGKLYFSFGDRGANVKTKEGKTLAFPDEGAVFRCNPDGSEMEAVYRGLRNPQELAFDNYGNLFTGDNDFDHGDEERLVYIVEGGDSGWRVGYQHAPLGFDFVPWKSEEIWMAHNSRQGDYNGQEVRNRVPDTGKRPAAYLPPVSNVGDGPSGFTFYPGTGFPAKYDNHFFLTHFKGAIANSKIQSFALKPKGATFELTDSQAFAERMQPTDCEFGPDGALYFADWGEGWERTKKGRIYRVTDPALFNSAEVLATKKLIGEGMERRSETELVTLLAHKNRNVRQEAQFELAERGAKSAGASSVISALAGVARKNDHQLARLHAIWGLGQIGRKSSKALEPLLPMLSDVDAEVRAQTAKVLGDGRVSAAFDGLVKAVKDESPRVRFFAALSLGKLGKKDAVPAVIEMLRTNNDQDTFLRHAGAMALAGINDKKSLAAAAQNISPAVRMGALLAMRKLESPEIAVFLADKEPQLVLEAARAINDAAITGAQPKLATLLASIDPAATGKNIGKGATAGYDPLVVRAINANFRVGSTEAAKALATFAAANGANQVMQVEALTALGTWAKPPQRDRIVGIYRPLTERSGKPASDALKPVVASILRNAPIAVRIAAAEAVAQLALKDAAPVLFELVSDLKQPANVRVAALAALGELKDKKLPQAVKLAQADTNESVRKEGNRLLALVNSAGAVTELAGVLEKGTLSEKQGALASLGGMSTKQADEVLGSWLDKLLAGQVAAELKLDVLTAAAQRTAPTIVAKLKQYEAARSKTDDLAAYRETLSGGDAAAGKKIFYERADAQCQRCHKINNEGGDVGPNLSDIAKRQTREYILESLVYPNKTIAAGFDSVTVVSKDGTSVAGVLKSENDQELVIMSLEDGLVKVKKGDIQTRAKGLSAMPEGMTQILTKQELRNLIEFLAGLK